MKIGYISNSCINEYSGRIGWMRKFKEEGVDITLVAPYDEYFEKFKKEGFKVINFKVERGGINPFREIKTIFELYKIFRREKFQIVHSFTPKINVYTSIAASLARIPFIVNHVTGLGYVFIEEGKNLKTLFLKLLLKSLLYLSFFLATKVIFQNNDDYKSFKIDERKKVLIKGSGVNEERFSKNNINIKEIEKIRKEFSINPVNIIITFIGRLLKHKGIEEFVKVCDLLIEKYNNLTFLIVGDYDKCNPAVISEEFFEKLKTKKHFRLFPRRDDIENIYFLTDIFVLPSYREGLPRTVIEAMAMEKPVVITDTEGCRDTITDGVEGFIVPPRKVEELNNAIENLILDEDLRKKMGEEGRKRVLKEFSNRIIIDKVKTIYNEYFLTD